MSTTYYTQTELQTEARRLAKQSHCVDCDKPMSLLGWEIAIDEQRIALVAQITCRAHGQKNHVRMAM